MTGADLTNINFLRDYLDQNKLMPRKKFGQNFAIDNSMLEKLMTAAELHPSDTVLEIGPGIGTLTERLLSFGSDVIAVEIDRGFCELLSHHFKNRPNFSLISGDFLKPKVQEELTARLNAIKTPVKVIANVPYYITTPIITTLFLSGIRYSSIVLTIQKEVAQRLAAQPGGKTYGSITIFARYYADCEIYAELPPQSFFPSPKVFSSIIRLTPYESSPYQCKNPLFFHKIVKLCFNERRKMIKNNVQKLLKGFQCDSDAMTPDIIDKLLADNSIKPTDRPENIDIAQYFTLSESLWKLCPENIKNKYA
ncbi:MAG: 16S rRNA (adenine(1518)-N(6)/adenine(1519)-N(6))-dimethyltransferase RsmA [Candidatus Auribacterota bacterium]